MADFDITTLKVDAEHVLRLIGDVERLIELERDTVNRLASLHVQEVVARAALAKVRGEIDEAIGLRQAMERDMREMQHERPD